MAEKLYRIWDKKEQKYYSTGKKSIWKSEAWAVNALKDIGGGQAQDYEIHVIEQVVAERKQAHILVQTEIDKALNRDRARRNHEILVAEVESITGLQFHVARMLYGQRRLIDSEMAKLKPYMKYIYDCEKIM